MYEFLAPWGVLAPAICGITSYFIVSNARRRQMLSVIEHRDQGPHLLTRLLD